MFGRATIRLGIGPHSSLIGNHVDYQCVSCLSGWPDGTNLFVAVDKILETAAAS